MNAFAPGTYRFLTGAADLQRALGEGPAARQFYEKALEIAERLVAQEPGRADYRIDLAKSLARLGGGGRLQRALDIVLELQRSQRLGKAEGQLIVAIEQLLEQANGLGPERTLLSAEGK